MAKRVPARSLYHENWRRGFIQNSPHGNDLAKLQGKTWVDNDFHLSSDRALVNAHGYPETVWGRIRFELRTWADLSKLRHRYQGRVYQLRTGAQAFRDAHKRGQSVEAEVKYWGKVTETTIPQMMAPLERMRRHAENTWGKTWQRHLNVKIVSTMGGGLKTYVFPMAELAHMQGIPVLITVRGRDRFRRSWPPYVTYVRGSLVAVR